MSTQVTLKANGLNYSPNNLSLPPGSLLVADDVVIRRDDTIESRRGFVEYSEGLGSSLDRLKQLIEYKGRLLANYTTKLAWDTTVLDADGKSIFNDFAGTYNDASTGLRMKSIEANKDLYFTTSEGIKTMSARTAADFSTSSGFIKNAGAIKALDFEAALSITQGQTSGILPSDTTVAYRVVWGYKNLNENLKLGVPSDRVIVYNYLVDQMTMDLNSLCVVLDIINQTVPISSVSVANPTTITTSSAHNLTTGQIVHITGTNTTASTVGSFVATVVNATQFTIPVNVTAVTTGSGTLSKSIITDGNYASSFYTPVNSSGSTLLNNVLQLAEKLDADILYADQGGSAPLDMDTIAITDNECTITFDATMTPESYFAVQDKIMLAGFGATFNVVNGAQTITAVDNTTRTIRFTVTSANIVSTAVAAAATIHSNNYRNIIKTGDEVYSNPLNALVLSIPPTSEQLRIINNNIFRIVERLKVEQSGVIPSALQTAYVTPFVMTERANVKLKITIPSTIDSDYFVQVYRTRNFTADGVQTLGDSGGIPVVADDEMRLVYEAFPTSAEIAAEELIFLDNYPEELIQNNTNLYTNPETGDGILKASYPPPFAKDINTFKNVTFYANSKTNYQIPILQLLGVSNISSGDKVTISNGINTNTYTFISGVQEVTDITFTMTGLAAGEYFILYSAEDATKYYFWYEIDGAGTGPVQSDGTNVKIPILSTFTDNELAQRSMDVINELIYDFSAVQNTLPVVRVTAANFGITTNGSVGTSPFTVSVITPGNGEDDATQQVLLSSLVSAAQAIDETARSFVRVINKQADSPVNAYYISGDNTPPGQINLETKNLSDPPFYIIGSAAGIGLSFNPEISPENTNISSNAISYTFTVSAANATAGATYTNNGQTFTVINTITSGTSLLVTGTGAPAASGTLTKSGGTGDLSIAFSSFVQSPTIITTSVAHGLTNGDKIVILQTGTQSTPSINGLQTVTVLSTTTFTIPVNVTVAGTTAVWTRATDIEYASNEVKTNRVYYSKLNQPDAVPILNYLDVGAEDKAILRIFPLRDSLFVFKEDGLYRISGEIEPFVLSLFDSSCILLAPDSVAVSNNEIYCWTLKGIVKVNETGVSDPPTSRPIDTVILKLASSSYTNFKTLTWGVGYDSDNTYTVYTNESTDDTVATIGWTYSNLTNTWTNVRRSQTCGIVLDTDDKLYMGSGEFNYIDKERKDFARTDFADDDFELNLAGGSLFNNNLTLKFTAVDDISVGDVIVQNQDLTIYMFNKILIQLDSDPGVQDTNYFTTLGAVPGDELRTKIEALATKLDLDLGLLGGYFDRIDTKTGTITGNTVGNPTVVTTSVAHELVNGRILTIAGTQSPLSSPIITGTQEALDVGTFGTSTTFELDIDVITAGGTGLTFSTAANESSFADMKACFNAIVARLNSDPGATYNTYKGISVVTPFEAVVTNVDPRTNKVTVNIPQQWIVGPVTVYKSIPCKVVYAPETMGDAVMSKQIFYASVMLESRAVTNFSASFASDLSPQFNKIEFNGSGNGIFGNSGIIGFGYGHFGGIGNSAPFTTIIPRSCQRCRYILVKVEHSVAREQFILNGVTLTGEVGKSTRSYR